jgi:hypothetical protein
VIDWRTVFMGVIALAILTIAVVHVALIVALAMLARQVTRTVQQIQRDVQPIVAQVHAIAADLSRTAALAGAQMERADQVFARIATRLDEVVQVVHRVVTGPAGRGVAFAAAFRSALGLVRDFKRRRRGRVDEEDALFI